MQQHDFWQLGLYIGPSPSVPGAIRAAVLINGEVHIITTSAIKGVSDGGQVSIYPTADTSINCLYEKDNAVHDPLAIVLIPEPQPPSQTPTQTPTHTPIPAAVPPLVPAPIIPTAVDPLNTSTTTDPVLPFSPRDNYSRASINFVPDATISIRSMHQRQG
jgi:hypothetical protein